MSNLVKAINKLRPTAQFSFIEDDYSTIKWDFLEGNAPTQEEIYFAIEQIKSEEKAQEQAQEAEAQAKQAKLESAKAKLTALGLDEEEVAALIN